MSLEVRPTSSRRPFGASHLKDATNLVHQPLLHHALHDLEGDTKRKMDCDLRTAAVGYGLLPLFRDHFDLASVSSALVRSTSIRDHGEKQY